MSTSTFELKSAITLRVDEILKARGNFRHAGRPGRVGGSAPSTTIKLKRTDNSKAQAALNEFTSDPSMFHIPNSHFYTKFYDNDKHGVGFELSAWEGAIHLGLIRTVDESRGLGLASKALKELTDVADRHGVSITGIVKPTTDILGRREGLNKSQLMSWYKRYGFEQEGGKTSEYIIRKPRAIKSKGNFGHSGRPGLVGGSTDRVMPSEMSAKDYADHLDSLSAKQLDNTDYFENGHGYELWEARHNLPKEGKLKKLNDRNAFVLSQDADYLANVDGEPFKVTKQEDPDDTENDKAFVYYFERMSTGRGDIPQSVSTTTSDPEELITEIRRWRQSNKSLKGSAESGNFGHAGRPGLVGGSASAYHGTPGEFRAKIMKEGLKPSSDNVNGRAVYASWNKNTAILYGLNKWQDLHPNLWAKYFTTPERIPNKHEIALIEVKRDVLKDGSYFYTNKRIPPSAILGVTRYRINQLFDGPYGQRKDIANVKPLKGQDSGYIVWLFPDDDSESLKGGEGSGNFNHAGRPGEVGGSAPALVAYHGTKDDLLKSIKEKGLIPGGGGLTFRTSESRYYIGDRAVQVYMSTDKTEAAQFAKHAAWKHNEYYEQQVHPVILKITIPPEFQDKLIKDESAPSIVRLDTPVPPEWITLEEELKALGGTVYAVIFYEPPTSTKGGQGSGNFNHQGRPGEVGGSLGRLPELRKEHDSLLMRSRKEKNTSKWKQAWQKNKEELNKEAERLRQERSSQTVFHGTTDAFKESILKDGLQVSKMGQGQGWTPDSGEKGHVFFSTERPTAEYWAEHATGNHGGKPMLLTLRIPKSEVDKISEDPDLTKVGGKAVGFRINRDIPPEWIVKVEEGKWP